MRQGCLLCLVSPAVWIGLRKLTETPGRSWRRSMLGSLGKPEVAISQW